MKVATISVQSVFEHIDKELKKEYLRDKKQWMDKWNVREIRTNQPKTALEQ